MFTAVFILFHKDHRWFGSGFLIGLLWFWWIGLSFRYYGLGWMIFIVDFFIAFFYGAVFWIIGKVYSALSVYNEYIAKSVLLLVFVFGFDYVSPFTFDWLKPEILFVNGIYGVDKVVLFLVMFTVMFYDKLKYLSFALLILALFIKPEMPKEPDLDIYVSYTKVAQDKKWNGDYIPYEIRNNFLIIQKAVKLHKDVVILPESAFPVFLNRYKDLCDRLKKLSYKITVITGALHSVGSKYYNSTYVFKNGKMEIFDKHMLVPFGEYIPLPFFQKEINELFFAGASDYMTSDKFGEFKIKNYRFINAICYEATVEKLYKLSPDYVVALSNDAWFMPSIMPSLQQMIIKTYAYKYSKIVYHSINGFKSYIIK
jgi:apolipoprotein N-acyltransferase